MGFILLAILLKIFSFLPRRLLRRRCLLLFSVSPSLHPADLVELGLCIGNNSSKLPNYVDVAFNDIINHQNFKYGL